VMEDGTSRIPSETSPSLGRRVLSSTLLRQSGFYTATNLGISLMGAVISALLARTLTTNDFGAYSFASAFLVFVAGFFEFGLFVPAGRLASTETASGQRQVAGAALLTYIPVGLVFSLLILCLSFVADGVFRVHAGGILRAASLLAFALPFGLLAEWLAVGTGRLHRYSLVTFGAQLMFLVMVSGALLLSRPISPARAVSLQLVAIGLGWVALAFWLQPKFGDAWRRVHQLLIGAREYGLQVYVGRVLSVATYNLDVPMLGALSNPAAVGYYVLAVAIAGASGMPALAFGTALFRNLANRPLIERRWFVISISVAAVSTVIAWLLAGPFVRVVFTERYDAAVALVVPLAAAAGVRGVTGLYNSFLAAHGLGKELRNAGMALTVSNLILNVGLIPPFGAAGAAWASLVALIINLGAHIVGYRRYRQRLAA
jgi:O-antigen/teichoic acid export membrane protein